MPPVVENSDRGDGAIWGTRHDNVAAIRRLDTNYGNLMNVPNSTLMTRNFKR